MRKHSIRLVTQLGLTQTLGYASSYYLPAVLAVPMSQSVGISFQQYFLFLAAASMISAFLGPRLGKLIDHYGGRMVLPLSSLVFAIGLVVMSAASDPWTLLLAWLILGFAMAAGLYDAAFAAVVEIQGEHSRQTIAGITLIAGFASTIGWPLTAWITETSSWQQALLFWAAVHIVIGLPLHLALPGYQKSARRERRAVRHAGSVEMVRGSMTLIILMGLLFALGGFIQVALGTHLPKLLESGGTPATIALIAATLLGPGQVLARILQVVLPNLFTPVRVAVAALTLHPLGVLAWIMLGQQGIFLFVFLHGMGSGFLTVAGGVLPLYIFGSQNYGQRQGYIMAASKVLLAFAPLLFGIALVSIGTLSLVLTVSLAFASLGILWWLMGHRKRVSTEINSTQESERLSP